MQNETKSTNEAEDAEARRLEREEMIDDAATQFARLFLRQALRMRAEREEQEKQQ